MTTRSPRASTTCVAVDARTSDNAGAEHLVHLLDAVLPAAEPGYVASTHLVPGEGPHTAVAASWPCVEGSAPAAEDVLELVAAAVDALGGVGIVVHGETGTASRGPEELVAGALRAGGEHRARSTGRLARYHGRSDVERRTTVAEVVALSVVDAVEALAGTDVEPTTPVDLTGWARPTWQHGRVVLLVQQGHAGLVPFESRDQIPCCSHH
ncbi:hypothetical protein [Nocardioides renjunii]|uniref:hypothetical protein n=1 Tax=Nocardioides renjunii TaxID=3095075 RepID=UPI002B00171A|nr:hypothetical protein [Nocardioides sp. S-34]WQQ20382.1 hypothetical protein SHK17_10700 [Nocardioides sp. S-34]